MHGALLVFPGGETSANAQAFGIHSILKMWTHKQKKCMAQTMVLPWYSYALLVISWFMNETR